MDVIPTIRASRKARLLAKVLRDVIRDGRFWSYADLWDAWKTRLARLRIRWTNDELDEARGLVESNANVLVPGTSLEPPADADEPADERPIGRDEAAALVSRLRAAVKREAAKGRHADMPVEPQRIPPGHQTTVDELNEFRRKAGLWAKR